MAAAMTKYTNVYLKLSSEMVISVTYIVIAWMALSTICLCIIIYFR